MTRDMIHTAFPKFLEVIDYNIICVLKYFVDNLVLIGENTRLKEWKETLKVKD